MRNDRKEEKLFRRNCGMFWVAVLTLIVVGQPVPASEKPIQLSLFSPIQLVPEDNAISGVRLSLLYGRNTYVTGLD
jgi:hypothetical protein